jgi:hypothetical protein
MNSIVNLKDGFITFNSNIDYSLLFSKCGIGYSNYNINSHERGSLVFLTNNNANTTNISMHSDIRMCIASDGNVGIGTNNPSQKLDILGNTNISRILKVGGIAQNEGEIKLQVYCAGSTNSADNLVAIFKHPNDSQGIGITYDSIIALGTSDTNATQPINIKSKGDASIFLNTNSTDRLTILGNGNVGIGTTYPNYKLDIQGSTAQTLRIMDTRATGDAIIALKETNDNNGFDMAYIGTTGDKFYIRGYNNSATPRVDFTIDRINSNVGIGMTDPKYKLDVAGTINASNILINGATVTANSLQWITSSSNVYTSNLLGNVGIGITNPSYKCHIKTITDNIASGLHLDADDTGSNPNKYALTIWPSLTGGQVGWKFRTQNSVSGGVNTPLEFTNSGSIRFKKDIWHSDSDGNARLYFNNAERTYIRGHGTTPIEFRNDADATIATFSSTGNLNITGSELYVGPDSGSSRIFLGGGAAGDTGYNHSVIESRNYSSTENTELLLFKGNDIGSPDSADRIRLRAGAIVFDTYQGASVDRAASNIRMVINGSGNVGVGTLTPLSGNKFHVEGNTYLNGDTSINGSLVVNSNLIVHGETTRLNTDVYTTERLELINAGSSTSFILRQTASGNTNNILNVINSATSNVFNITSAGNIGIGTTNPNANLHLHGNAASQNVRISFTDNTSGVATTDGFCIGKDTEQVGYIYNTESNAISIGTHNTERIRILANGNVGIGTNNIAYKLHIKCIYDNIASGLHLDASDATPPNQYGLTIYPYVIGAGQVGWKFRTQSQTGGTNTPLTLNHAGNITMTGNVGIGTTNPGYKLDIQGDAAQTLRILDTRAAGDAIVALKELNDNNGFDMAYLGSTDDRFYIRGYNNSATPRVDLAIDRITSNVGIGMTNPKYKLDVAGTINASNILINGSIVTANSLQWITSSSNVYTSNLSGNIGIGTNDNIQSKLTINPIVFVNNGFNHSEAPLTITNPTQTSFTIINDPKSVLHLCREGTTGQTYGARASFKLCRYENTSANSRTRLDITLAHNFYDDINTMSITSGGNVGIGTTAPNSVLDIVRTSASGVAVDMLNTRFDNNWGLKVQQNYVTTDDIRYNLIHRYNATNYNSLTFKGTNVGIGTTNPQRPLHIQSAMRIGGSGPALDFGDDFNNQIYRTTTLNELRFTTNSTDRLVINPSGNIGIGTTNPGYKLDIQGGAAQTLRILDTRAAGDAIVALKELNDNNGFDMAYLGSTDDRFYIRGYNNSATPRVDLAIDRATGNIGIGVNGNIDEKLLVNGNVKITNGFLLTCNIITNTLNATSITGAGSNITNINANNITTGTINSDRLPIASVNVLGGLKVDGIITTTSNNTLNFVTPSSYFMPNTETVARLYPPIRNFTGASGTTTSISGQPYGNGNYTVNYTSMEDPFGFYVGPANVFNTNEDESYWRIGNYTNGTYNKTLSIVGDASYKGDGIKIQMPVQIRLTSYTLKHAISWYSRAPKDFKIYGSNDGVTWVVLVHKTVIDYGTDRLYTENITINEYYSHYALSVNKILQSFNNLVLSEWFINGYEVLSLGYNYKKNSIIKYVAGNQSDINLRNKGIWQISDDVSTATNTVLGIVKGGGNISIAIDGTISAIGNNITNIDAGNIALGTINSLRLPIAANSVLGGVKKGNNINIAGDGTISVDLVSYSGDSTINGNLVVNSNLTVHGTTTQLNTDVYTTERLEITNGGTASSTFSVRQTASGNANNILNVINSATSNVFNITSTGNIGIGTNNPNYKLDIQGGAAQTLRILDTRAAGDAIVALKELNDNNGFDMAYLGSTDDRFYIRGYNNSATPRVDLAIDRITSNVGIGMTNPKYKLDVAGTINASNILINGSIISASSSQWITTGTKMYNNNTGNVGIGTTNPNHILHLHKNATEQDVRIALTDNSSTASSTRGLHLIKYSDNSSYLWNYESTPLTIATSDTERIVILANGNVGIGTTNPRYKLDIQGDAAQTLRIIDTRTAGDAIVALKELNDNNGFDMAYIGSTDDRFYIRGYNNSATPRVDLAIDRITSNVGIGMTNPKYKLDVAGTINASNILINGSIISASSSQWITSGANIYANNLLGNVGIGTNNPSAYTLQVNGTIGASGNITASYSDERLKNITEYVRDVLPILNKINVFKYNCNDLAASYGYDKNKKEIGLSAQEVQKYYPEVVSIAPFDSEYDEETKNITSKSCENYLTLDYERLVPILLQGIKDLNNKVVEMEENEIHMKNELNNIKSRLDKLELI